MKRTYTILSTLLLAFLLSANVFAQEATQATDATPTVEAVATEVAVPTSEPVTDTNTVLDWMQFIIDNNLHWYIFAFITVLFVGNLVPQSELAARREQVKKTDTPVDDTLVAILELVQSIKGNLPSPQPTITVTAPTSPTNTTGSGQETTITVSQPPVTVYPTPTTQPETPVAIVRNFGVFDPNLTFDKTFVNDKNEKTIRRVYVPVNTSPLFSPMNAAGVEYPYPSVNVNPAYGVQFDIAYVAGAYGFTVMETLVANVAYKVRLDYSAQITGSHLSNLPEWLWHELDVNGKITGVNQGISNGVSYAEWGITGTGFPVMITPRIRSQWASSEDNSVVSWQRLSITPVFQAEAAILPG